MLLLSRKVGERIIIPLADGAEVWITLVDIDRGKARIGITAPREVPVYREELLGRDQRPPAGGE